MKLDLSKLQLDDHAKQRIAERFGHNTDEKALQFCRSMLGKAICMGENVCERGHKSIMYGTSGMAFYLAFDNPHLIKTVVKVDRKPYLADVERENPLYGKLLMLYEKELRKCEKFEQSYQKRIISTQLEIDIKIAQLRHRIHKTRSKNVKEECETLIKSMQTSVTDMQISLNTMKSNKRKIARALTALI
jgi:hypothetical protein